MECKLVFTQQDCLFANKIVCLITMLFVYIQGFNTSTGRAVYTLWTSLCCAPALHTIARLVHNSLNFQGIFPTLSGLFPPASHSLCRASTLHAINTTN